MMERHQGVSGFNCPVCHGTGWRLYLDSFPEMYGEDAPPVLMAVKCPECQDKIRLGDITGVPAQFAEADLQKFNFSAYSRSMEKLKRIVFDFLDNFRSRWEAAGKGLYFWSKTPGSGKTFLASCLGRSVMLKHDLRFRFVTATDYLACVGDSYKREIGADDASEVYRKCDLLVIDDIGEQKSGEWQEQELFRLINERLNAGKITVYTSNFPPDSLNLDSRTISRVKKTAIVLQMPEESIRDKQTQAEQDRFLRDIIKEPASMAN